MTRSIVLLTAMMAGAVVSAVPASPTTPPPAQSATTETAGELRAHEWGTFTTVAGPDGRPIDWLPLGGPTDLPCFVQHYKNDPLAKVRADRVGLPALSYEQARSGLRGTVRMETPVLYFYAPRQTVVNVSVKFPRGIITEWYPLAATTQENVTALTLKGGETARIDWKNVVVDPQAAPAFPSGSTPSHYYAARATDAASLSTGGMNEKFLFYRGIGSFAFPLAVTPVASSVHKRADFKVENLGGPPIPNMILFENQRSKVGFRAYRDVVDSVVVDPASLSGDLESLRRQLETILVERGLFEKEARAMVKTWDDSWFEPGTRVFYVLPASAVDQALPLEIFPKPAQTARVFVGRLEVLSDPTINIVHNAIISNDTATLALYNRFLGPIAERLAVDPRPRFRPDQTVTNMLDAAYKAYIAGFPTCRE
jgi:hypothetical protein